MITRTTREKELNKLLFNEDILFNPAQLKNVLQHGADPNVTMLTYTMCADKTTPITTLLTKHYDSDTDEYGDPNCIEVLEACKILIEAGADLFKYEVSPDENEDVVRSAIQKHILHNSFTVNPLILFLEEQGINFANSDPYASPLMYTQSPEIVRFLLDKGVDPNGMEVTIDNETFRYIPLLKYIELQHDDALELIKLIVDAGADVNLQFKDTLPALVYACMNGKYQVAEYLLDNGADPLALDNGGNTALEWVQEFLKLEDFSDTDRARLISLKERLEPLTNKKHKNKHDK